jgi:RES domain
MSLLTWTQDEVLSSARPLRGKCWRSVEAQHHVSTTKLTDSQEEQRRLEELIEETKPQVPEECRGLDFLLFTPFRYAPYPTGSRFRRTGRTAGVFYASDTPKTAIAERAFYKLLFFAESPGTPWPREADDVTVFAVEYETLFALDLSAEPFSRDRAHWTHLTNYDACQEFADIARQSRINVIRYQSVRDTAGFNLALLSCTAFAKPAEVGRQTWRMHLSDIGVKAVCEMPSDRLDFGRSAFSSDPRLANMNWDREST